MKYERAWKKAEKISELFMFITQIFGLDIRLHFIRHFILLTVSLILVKSHKTSLHHLWDSVSWDINRILRSGWSPAEAVGAKYWEEPLSGIQQEKENSCQEQWWQQFHLLHGFLLTECIINDTLWLFKGKSFFRGMWLYLCMLVMALCVGNSAWTHQPI